MLKKTLKSKKQNKSTLIYRTPNVKENKENNPYIYALEDEVEKMKEKRKIPSPSPCSKPILAQILS